MFTNPLCIHTILDKLCIPHTYTFITYSSNPPHQGFERILDLYIKTRLTKGLTIPEMMGDPELRSKIHFLIEKQAQEMKLYMIDHKIKLEPGMVRVYGVWCMT
ncbi:hypothetical protein EON63_09125 [archaeon]|nr:MAG: hypothetical protein EON63_09125 [archaeon]